MSEPLKLMPENVDCVFKDCLFSNDTPRDVAEARAIRAEGIMCTIGFDPDKLQQHADDIDDLLDQLPAEFEKGWSFLQLCTNREGELWTGVHQTCDQLMQLGLARGRVRYCVPRAVWASLPGGLPYVFVAPREERGGAHD